MKHFVDNLISNNNVYSLKKRFQYSDLSDLQSNINKNNHLFLVKKKLQMVL